jgi:hypothetical protein
MRERRTVCVFLAAALGSIGCRSQHDGGAASTPDATPLPSCPQTSATWPAYQSDGSGAVIGADVTATLCHVGVHLYVSPYTAPAGRVLLMLNSSSHDSPQAPMDATGGLVTGTLSIDSPISGVYPSSGKRACGNMQYEFQLPVPSGTNCDGGTPPACPAGCVSICSSIECLPCAPNPPTVAYQAATVSDCLGFSQSAGGSWQVELMSATPVAGPDPSADYYLVHGSLTANLHAETSSAMLSLVF